jgi:DNA-binding transcriptional regulator WhiA
MKSNRREVPSRGALLAYVTGVALGDGNLSNPNKRATRLRITCDARYPRLALKIMRSIQHLVPANKVSVVPRAKTWFDISCYSNHWEELLGWRAGKGSKISQAIRIPDWIKENRRFTICCLRGLIETDGSIYWDRGYQMMMFTTAAASLAEEVHSMISSLGFKPHTYVIQRKPRPIFHIRVSKHVAEFLSLVRPSKC